MRNLLSLVFMFITCGCFSQIMDHIIFDYDQAGNQIKRYLVDLNPDRQSNPVSKDVRNLDESDMIMADIYDDIKYYPNPVKIELYIEWQVTESSKVVSLELYDLSGKLLKKINQLEDTDNYIFSFQDFPQAIYSLNLVYSNGIRKSLKILKH